MRVPRLARLLCAAALLVACSGEQEGYYGPCDEPAGLAVGCDPVPEDAMSFTPWDACMKLARCGVILTSDDREDPEDPKAFDDCVDEIEQAAGAQGDTVLACIEFASCPDLARTDPETLDGDPNPAAPNIEGVIGFCGRLDP